MEYYFMSAGGFSGGYGCRRDLSGKNDGLCGAAVLLVSRRGLGLSLGLWAVVSQRAKSMNLFQKPWGTWHNEHVASGGGVGEAGGRVLINGCKIRS